MQKYRILIAIGKQMKRIPNAVVSELIRLLPVLIASIPPGQSLRVQNAIRITNKLIKKLKSLKEDETDCCNRKRSESCL